jgi:hypothetical protein
MVYSISVSRENAEYREGNVSYNFFLGTTVEVPRAEDWDRVVPEEFRNRRGEILDRLKTNYQLASTPFLDVFA